MRSAPVLTVLLWSLLATGVATAAQPDYEVRCLGAGGQSSGAKTINERGEILGWSSLGETGNPYRWIVRDGTLERTDATLIDSSGGQVLLRDGRFLLAQDDEIVADLGETPASAIVSAMNDHGQIVGTRGNRATMWMWDERGVRRVDLGTLGGRSSYATAINQKGEVVGSAALADGNVHAFLWRDGTMFDLGGLTGMRGSIAYAINSSGTIVGSAYSSEGLPRAVLWDESGLHDLGTLTGGERSYSDAKGISDDGTVVGGSHDLSQHEAFVWVDGTMYGLAERSYEASAINSRGEIVGSGTCGAVIATPR